MAKIYVLCSRGHEEVEFPSATAVMEHPTTKREELDAREAIAEAEALFARERSRGSSAFKLVPGEPAERIDRFDRTAEEIMIIPRMAGG